jgi:hypothetical protein
VLIETGKKLYPSTVYGTTNGVYATPDNTNYGAPWPGVTTYMVGVLDPNTLLSGFIDPNSKIFAIFNSDCPTYVPRGVDVSGTVVDEGAPVITLGSVRAGTYSSAPHLVISPATTNSNNAAGAYAGIGTLNGASPSAASISNLTVTNSSLIFVSLQGGGAQCWVVSRTAGTGNGSFVVNGPNGSVATFSWMIVN